MPHFYFHLREGPARQDDPEGVILPDAEAAFYQAFRSVRDRFGDGLRDPCIFGQRQVEVEDESGAPVWTIPLFDIAGVAG